MEDNREETLYIVAELPFFGDDSEMELGDDLLFCSVSYKSYSEALEVFRDRVEL